MASYPVWQSPPDAHAPSIRDVRLLSGALLLMIKTAERITRECSDVFPPYESPAFYLVAATEDFAVDAFHTMRISNLSAFDHGRAFVTLLRTPRVPATALATVSRGALESLARTSFLLSRTDNQDFVHRSLSLLYTDLKFPEKYKEQLWTRAGAPVDPTEQRDVYKAQALEFGARKPVEVSYGKLVTSMLDQELQDEVGAQRYSDVSAVAHASRLALNTYLVIEETGHWEGLHPNRFAAYELVANMLAGISATMGPFIDLHGGNPGHRDRLEVAETRAAAAMVLMDEAGP